MKNINHELGKIEWDETDLVYGGDKAIKGLSCNDIIIVAKGERNTAVLIEELPYDATASNHFFIISLSQEAESIIDSKFLNWYLNYPARKHLQAQSLGAVIPNLRKDILDSLQIHLPSLGEQRSIVGVYETMIEQKLVFDQLFQDRISLLCHQVSKFK